MTEGGNNMEQIEIPVNNIISCIIFLEELILVQKQSDKEKLASMISDLAGYVLRSVTVGELRMEILEHFGVDDTNILAVEYANEFRILSEVFGSVLFGRRV